MSLPLRIVLLVGCGLVASLEAPEAGAWLSAGLSGPYDTPPSRPPDATASLPGLLPAGFVLEPVLFTLAPVPLALRSTLAVGR